MIIKVSACLTINSWYLARFSSTMRALLRINCVSSYYSVDHIISDFNHQRVSMPNVRVKENESFEIALRRFKRTCEKAGLLTEVRRREFYEKPSSVRKREAAAAVKRQKKRVSREHSRHIRLY